MVGVVTASCLVIVEPGVRGLRSCIVLLVCLVGWPVFADDADKASTIVMLTWRGQTAAETGFTETLAASGRAIDLVQFDAGRDRAALAKFLRDNVDLLKTADGIYTFGTLTARVVQSLGLKDVPHVFNIVADPVGTNLVENLKVPGVARTGAKNTVPLKSLFSVLSQAVEFSKVAVIFDPRELTSEVQLTEASALVTSMGRQVKSVRFVPDAQNSKKQLELLETQLKDVDLVFVPAVSSLITHMETIAKVAPEESVVAGVVEAQVHKGATISIGTDFHERGRVAGNMMLSILDGADPALIPVNEVQIEDAKIVINVTDPRSVRINKSVLPGRLVDHGEPWQDDGPVAER